MADNIIINPKEINFIKARIDNWENAMVAGLGSNVPVFPITVKTYYQKAKYMLKTYEQLRNQMEVTQKESKPGQLSYDGVLQLIEEVEKWLLQLKAIEP